MFFPLVSNAQVYFNAKIFGPVTNIYSLDEHGNIEKTTDNSAWRDREPTVSSAGDVVFSSNREARVKVDLKRSSENFNIYIKRNKTKDIETLITSKQQDILPRFNPKGTSVAYLKVVGKSKTELHVVDVNSKKDKLLAHADNIFDFAWSPDGKKIALSLLAGKMSHINIINIKDKNVATLLTSSAPSDKKRASNSIGKKNATQQGELYLTAPSWSPDGKKLAFIKHPANANESKALFVVDIASTKEQRISSEKVQVQAPINWSSDGKKLLYSGLVGYRYYYDEAKRDRVYEGGMQIFVATPGRDQDAKQLTQGDHLHSYPVFSPDQKRVAFLYSDKLGDVRTVSLKTMEFSFENTKPKGLKELYKSVARDSKIVWR